MKRWIISAVLPLVAGCASLPEHCDPNDRNASLLTKMQCDAGGGYRGRVLQQEQGVTEAQERNAAFRQVYADIQASQAAVRADLAAQRKAEAALDASLRTLLQQSRAKANEQQETRRTLQRLEQDLASRQQTNVRGGDVQAKQRQLQDLQAQVTRLQRSLGYE